MTGFWDVGEGPGQEVCIVDEVGKIGLPKEGADE